MMSTKVKDAHPVLSSATVMISNDGGWCWFESARALQHDHILLIGSVASGGHEQDRHGNIELHVFDCSSKVAQRITLHKQFELDDHDSPALLFRPDGRLLVVYAKHGTEPCNYARISSMNANRFDRFDAVEIYTPSPTTELTYANLYMLSNESNRIYNFFRGLDGSYKPSFVYSDDLGETWRTGHIFIEVPSTVKHRPYVRYTSNQADTIHMIYTEGHPRDYDNSLYHVFYRNGFLYQSDGTQIRSLSSGLKSPEEGTRIYQGDGQHVPWIIDVVLDYDQHPVCVYSVQHDSAGLPVGQGGDHIRYRYAKWDGCQWRDYSLAYAGSRLYPGEDDYTGLAAIEPEDPSIVYISTNSDPVTGEPLLSDYDKHRHYEMFYGKTNDDGRTWIWVPITKDSSMDNLRPIRPSMTKESRHCLYRSLIWLRGNYHSYTNYSQEIVGRIWSVEQNESKKPALL